MIIISIAIVAWRKCCRKRLC